MREKEKKIVELDGVDKTILNHLSEDARRSVVRIAKEIGISATAIHKRIRKLEAAGVITGSYITFDYSMINYSTTAFVGIYLDKSSNYNEAINNIENIKEVLEAYYTTGNYAIFVKILCKNNQHLMEILSQSVQKIKGVVRTETVISLHQKINRSLKF